MAAQGYPGDVEKGSEIRNLDEAASDPAVHIFHAGTKADGDRVLANGGRVLNVTARARLGDTMRRGLPTRPSIRLTGRKAFAAATSAGGPLRGRRHERTVSGV
jgi:hypothetical protein